jgi:hypothetical protein
MPRASLFDRPPVARIKSIHIEECKPVERPCKFYPAAPGEIIAPETSIRKYRISAEKNAIPFGPETDAPRGMPRRMKDHEFSDNISFPKYYIRDNAGGTCSKMYGKALEVINKSPRIVFMNSYLRFTHMSNLFYPRGMIEVAMRQDDGIDLIFEGLDAYWRHTGVDKNRAVNIGVGKA